VFSTVPVSRGRAFITNRKLQNVKADLPSRKTRRRRKRTTLKLHDSRPNAKKRENWGAGQGGPPVTRTKDSSHVFWIRSYDFVHATLPEYLDILSLCAFLVVGIMAIFPFCYLRHHIHRASTHKCAYTYL